MTVGSISDKLSDAQNAIVKFVLNASEMCHSVDNYNLYYRQLDAEVAVWHNRDKSTLHQLAAATRSVLDGYKRAKSEYKGSRV